MGSSTKKQKKKQKKACFAGLSDGFRAIKLLDNTNVYGVLVSEMVSNIFKEGMWQKAFTPYMLILTNDDNIAVGNVLTLNGITKALAGVAAGRLMINYLGCESTWILAGFLGILGIVVNVLCLCKDDVHFAYALAVLWAAYTGLWNSCLETSWARSVVREKREDVNTSRQFLNKLTTAMGPLFSAAIFVYCGDEWDINLVEKVMLFGTALTCLPVLLCFCFRKSQEIEQEVSLLDVEELVFPYREVFDADVDPSLSNNASLSSARSSRSPRAARMPSPSGGESPLRKALAEMSEPLTLRARLDELLLDCGLRGCHSSLAEDATLAESLQRLAAELNIPTGRRSLDDVSDQFDVDIPHTRDTASIQDVVEAAESIMYGNARRSSNSMAKMSSNGSLPGAKVSKSNRNMNSRSRQEFPVAFDNGSQVTPGDVLREQSGFPRQTSREEALVSDGRSLRRPSKSNIFVLECAALKKRDFQAAETGFVKLTYPLARGDRAKWMTRIKVLEEGMQETKYILGKQFRATFRGLPPTERTCMLHFTDVSQQPTRVRLDTMSIILRPDEERSVDRKVSKLRFSLYPDLRDRTSDVSIADLADLARRLTRMERLIPRSKSESLADKGNPDLEEALLAPSQSGVYDAALVEAADKKPAKEYRPNILGANVLVTCDVLNAIGAGTSLKFMDLFLKVEYGVSPAGVFLLAFVQNMFAAWLTPFAKHLLSRLRERGYRAKFAVVLIWSIALSFLGLLCLPNMPLPVVLVSIVMMQSLNSSTKAYNRAQLVNYLPHDKVATYMTWDSLNKANQGGVAVFGGQLIAFGGYRSAFLGTFIILLVRLLVYLGFALRKGTVYRRRSKWPGSSNLESGLSHDAAKDAQCFSEPEVPITQQDMDEQEAVGRHGVHVLEGEEESQMFSAEASGNFVNECGQEEQPLVLQEHRSLLDACEDSWTTESDGDVLPRSATRASRHPRVMESDD